VLAVFDRYLSSQPSGKQVKSTIVERAEGTVERIFYTYEKVQKTEEEAKSIQGTVSIVTNVVGGDSLVSKLQFQEKMRLVFYDKDSLALKSL
jgi:hypothetical protein